MPDPRVAVVGATGAVGPEVLAILAERGFPAAEVVPFASARSAGSRVGFAGEQLEVRELTDDSLAGFDLALFSAGAGTSRRYAPEAVKRGCMVIDKSSAFRMEPQVPLVVPEVNPEAADGHRGIISNPNCSTIQLVVALKPLHDRARIRN
ncbi:MAG TPA: aspartate-semialdehyde dehydrogenase, partial [Gaiellales bacterium]|nr:aspartate-semialdehyde dehydrogenase [Gaiellales bacterium]